MRGRRRGVAAVADRITILIPCPSAAARNGAIFGGVCWRHWRRVGQSIGGDAIGTPQTLKGVTGARADGHGLSAAVNRPAECLYSLQVRVSGISESIDETLLTCSRFWRKDRRYATLSHPLSYRGKVPQPGP